MPHPITYIDQVNLVREKIILRADFNVNLSQEHRITNDLRIRDTLPTINFLLKNNNKLILVSHLGEPKGRDYNFSLKPIGEDLQKLLPNYKITLIDDFLSPDAKNQLANQTEKQIILLENIRFYKEEKENDKNFAKKIAKIADTYVNDAFAVSHRNHASIVGVPSFLPSYGGLLLNKEVKTILKIIENPKKPFVAILGGSKVSTKITLLSRLIEKADYLLLGGALANTFLAAQNYNIGRSLYENEKMLDAIKLIEFAEKKGCNLILPVDAVTGSPDNKIQSGNVSLEKIGQDMAIYDIGEKSQKLFSGIISQAATILWNGPLGFFEDKRFRQGTDKICQAITSNHQAFSVVGGGNTIAAISNQPNLAKISYISTGGGAMLELIENGTLPGLEALKNSVKDNVS